MKKTILTALLAACTVTTISSQTRVIAHRGFWDTPGSAQNSIRALEKADSIGCYGSEFDVWLAGDNELVVNHDSQFNLKGITTTSSAELIKLKLKNGEPMPTLREYLERGAALNIKLILELKPHKDDARETLAVQKIVQMVSEMGLEDRMEYISFSKHGVQEFIRLAPQNTPVYYLNGDLNPAELKELGCTGPDYHLNLFRRNPEWIEQSHQLGLKVNCWTINKEKDMEWLINNKVDFITSDNPVRVMEMISEK